MKKGLKSVLSVVTGATIGAAASAIAVSNAANKATQKAQMLADKHLALFLLMNQWVEVKQQDKNLKDYFEKNHYKTIAIYGMSYVGESLVEELKGSDVVIKYGVDKNADNIYSEIDIITMEDDFESVDAIIVTPIFFFDEIEEELSKKVDCPIISIDDILYDV